MIRTTLCTLVLALAAAPSVFSQRLEAEFIGTTAGRPTSIAFAPGVTDRMYVTEKTGRIWIVKDGTYQAPPFMDLRPIVNADGEGGLLGMVFDPQFAANGRFYISYNGGLGQGESLISRFTVQAGSIDFGDPNSEQILFGPVAQTTGRHKGGDLMFGPDGDLYFALGDGGVPSTAQDLASPKGKVHRIDPNLPFPHAPADNPFVGTPGAVPTIWARGFRNPWRFDVDPATGDVYVGDVGEGTWEEITRLVSQQAGGGGENAGWPCLEGVSCFAGGTNCDCTNPTFTAPIALLSHSNPDNACSIIAGGVYRGSRIPSLAGQLVFTDFCSGSYYSLEDPAGASPTIVDVSGDIDNGGNLIRFVATWGRDQEGELYFAEHYGSNIWKIAPRGGF
ncbi:MAG: PQQ-dependent sugar dehydrogenase, partial [Planctomycetota bacterium]